MAIAIGVFLVALGGCQSTNQLQVLTAEIESLQSQVLDLESRLASKEDLAQTEAVLRDRLDSAASRSGDTEAELRGLREELVTVGEKVEETGSGVGVLTEEILAAKLELASLAQQWEVIRTTPVSPSDSSDPDVVYQTAYDEFTAARYDTALVGFQHFVDAFPTHDQADNALYWTGECYYQQSAFRAAIRQYSEVERRYPDSERLASALLRQAAAYLELDNKSLARDLLERVAEEYSGLDEARLAQQQLLSLDS